LVGFNLGIEAIQIAIAAVVFLLLGWLRRKQQALALKWVQSVTLGLAVGLACVWLIQRLQ
jgi:L-cystine uptake protein TcyP (sodium:dicarboxylate symporter family)